MDTPPAPRPIDLLIGFGLGAALTVTFLITIGWGPK